MSNGLLFIIWWAVYDGLNCAFWYIRGKFWSTEYTPGDRAMHDVLALIIFFALWFFVVKP